jgi:hypothetical protein
MEPIHVKPDGNYFSIYWGPTLICTVWSTRYGADVFCALLEALRTGRGLQGAWGRFCAFWRSDRSKPAAPAVDAPAEET